MSLADHYRRCGTRHALALITPPAAGLVTLTQFKAQLRDYGADSDTFLQAILDTAINQIDPATGGWLDRAMLSQTWELRLDRFPLCGGDIKLPYPPLISISSVTYTDTGGTSQTLALTTGYRRYDRGPSARSYLRPPYMGFWPRAIADTDDAVKIRYVCGYANAAAVPAGIGNAVLLMAKALYDMGKRDQLLTQDTVIGVSSRGFTISEEAANIMRNAAERLLAPYRVFS